MKQIVIFFVGLFLGGFFGSVLMGLICSGRFADNAAKHFEARSQNEEAEPCPTR